MKPAYNTEQSPLWGEGFEWRSRHGLFYFAKSSTYAADVCFGIGLTTFLVFRVRWGKFPYSISHLVVAGLKLRGRAFLQGKGSITGWPEGLADLKPPRSILIYRGP